MLEQSNQEAARSLGIDENTAAKRFSRGRAMLAARLVISPLICAGMCRLFGITGLAYQVFVVESALPVVSQVTVMAGDFGADDKYAATGATLSTLACFITIPVLMVLMG